MLSFVAQLGSTIADRAAAPKANTDFKGTRRMATSRRAGLRTNNRSLEASGRSRQTMCENFDKQPCARRAPVCDGHANQRGETARFRRDFGLLERLLAIVGVGR